MSCYVVVSLASWWRHPKVEGESGTPTDWLSSLPGRLVEVHCVCALRVAAERFLGRARHDGHLDRTKRHDDLAESFEQLAALGPLGLGTFVLVNTESDVDLDSVLRAIH